VSQRPVAERKKKTRAACGGDCGDAWPFATAIQTTTATQHQSFKTTLKRNKRIETEKTKKEEKRKENKMEQEPSQRVNLALAARKPRS
jgi:hypothetical protein